MLSAIIQTTIRALEDESGWPLEEAVREGAVHTARAVLTTGAVAALGFMPMAIATGAGAEVQRPLATVVVSGIAFSTVLTLFIRPGLLELFMRRRRPRAGHRTHKDNVDVLPANGGPPASPLHL